MRKYSYFDKMAFKANDCLLKGLSCFVIALGPIFVIAFYALLLFNTYCFFTMILPSIYSLYGQNTAIALVGFGLTVLFNIVFNNVLCIITDPGSIQKLKKLEAKADNSVLMKEEDYKGMSNDMKQILKFSRRSSASLHTQWQKICRYCNEIKPIRAHHCSMCKRCVFKMDHHCPWVNNCLGLNNQRYFMLFIIYLCFGTLFMLASTVIVKLNDSGERNKSGGALIFVLALSLSVTIVLIGFNIWNWFLAFKGSTAIEYWGGRKPKHPGERYDFKLPSFRDNLYLIFGTYNYFKMLLPSLRPLPVNGLEWTYEALYTTSAGNQMISTPIPQNVKNSSGGLLREKEEEMEGMVNEFSGIEIEF